ncbi:MAG: RNA polymerase sigma factor [Gemmatimonadota bacterium]
MDSPATPRGGALPGANGPAKRPADVLVEAARRGRPGAFEAIVRAHQDRVYAFCSRMLADREEALDAAQDVFLSAWRNLDGFRGDASLTTWLLKIAANRCLNVLRRRTARAGKETNFSGMGPGAGVEDETTFEPEGRAADRPDRIVEERELGAILLRALGRIDPESRSLVLLSDVEGLSYEEIAGAAGLPLGTVKSKLHRARMALRKMLAAAV